ncbi:Vitamin B12 import ATP-binding protein BtuD [Paenibacillus plantiphilus]|uniref:Vitamin B12 import ATP-binding protein BtuD n=1 Tax=Paenibacillus plantiphilus TaxID=2905650 RepID=A0ABN8GJJ0_9BACL|nr:ABC transporter ATP-binding protein [Paenibacillus plantiphilus]CAH1208780.1 Vitamin B12 import ATP-binding protein BtuD [Paenibacillus plantiphilus]
MNAVVECTNLNRSYGRSKAVRSLNLKLEENTIYGLLGRNGAGKTTLLNMITGGDFPDYGEIAIAGKPLRRGESPADTCYIREKNFLFKGFKVIEILKLASKFQRNWDWDFAHELIHTFKLNPNKKIRQLSRGMESLVGNIIGLASRAPLTIYDEPVLGLDVIMREKFYRLLVEDYAEHPRTILLSTHLIDEIAKVVERIYIIEEGAILLHDDVDNIRAQSHMLTGASEAIAKFTLGKRVLYQDSYGNHTLAAVYDVIEESDRAIADSLGISIEGLPLQKFFAYLIEGGEQIG